MHDKDLKLLEESFKKYYFDHFNLIHVPENTSKREFGYQKFNSGMIRHLNVKDDNELHLMLITNIPSDIYCSNGHYSFPNFPMAEKDWQEADLIFDIDAKDLQLECRIEHTYRICSSCKKIFQKDTLCTHCKSSKYESKSLPCLDCINAAKNEINKLLKILVNDLGVTEESVHVYFSGNEGFHVYVYDSQFQQLGSRERSELVDYIMFRGIIPETFGMKRFNPDRSVFPSLDEKGWRGRVSKEIFGSKSKRSKIITQIIANGYQSFEKQLQKLSPIIGVAIDPSVTMDIHRIFRLPGSLNSKSGLTKIHCDNLEKFNPYADACFIDEDSVQIIANCPSEFRLKNKKFGPYSNESVSVPKYAAVYMICKGLATVA